MRPIVPGMEFDEMESPMRFRPYTTIGIRRLRCFRCGRRAKHQWRTCADGCWRPICERCDIALNSLVLRFMRDPEREQKMKKYRERIALTQ